MASKDCFCRLLEINHLICHGNMNSDSLFPAIFEIYKHGDLSKPLVIFGMRSTELRMYDKYEWAHGKLVGWIMKQNGQL
jgi:glucose-6-phosphate 1-dehydrogenase